MQRDKDWQKLEDYIAFRLTEIDPYAKHTKASGGSTIKGDVQNSCGLHVECKQRNTSSVTVNNEVWKKLNNEIPLHAVKTALLALENKEGKRWAVVDLDDFLDLYIASYKSCKLLESENEKRT